MAFTTKDYKTTSSGILLKTAIGKPVARLQTHENAACVPITNIPNNISETGANNLVEDYRQTVRNQIENPTSNYNQQQPTRCLFLMYLEGCENSLFYARLLALSSLRI